MFVTDAGAASKGQTCDWTAPDNHNQNYLHHSVCYVTVSGSMTEIEFEGRMEIWQADGPIGRQLSPGMAWTGNTGWYRDYHQDRVLWEGTAKKSMGPCYDRGPTGNGWDFSNGMRICVY